MEDYQKRMLTEERDLSVKVDKLNTFVTGNASMYHSLSPRKQELLIRQLSVMREYLSILRDRIFEEFGDDILTK